MIQNCSQSLNPSHGIAACTLSVTAAKFCYSPPDNSARPTARPHDPPHWFIDASLAAQIITEFEAHSNRTVVDYEHQTLFAALTNNPAFDGILDQLSMGRLRKELRLPGGCP